MPQNEDLVAHLKETAAAMVRALAEQLPPACGCWADYLDPNCTIHCQAAHARLMRELELEDADARGTFDDEYATQQERY